jgi:hypothetical protein
MYILKFLVILLEDGELPEEEQEVNEKAHDKEVLAPMSSH